MFESSEITAAALDPKTTTKQNVVRFSEVSAQFERHQVVALDTTKMPAC